MYQNEPMDLGNEDNDRVQVRAYLYLESLAAAAFLDRNHRVQVTLVKAMGKCYAQAVTLLFLTHTEEETKICRSLLLWATWSNFISKGTMY